MLQGTKPITLVVAVVALGTLTSLVLRVSGQAKASYIALMVTAVIVFLPLILFGVVRLVETVRRRR